MALESFNLASDFGDAKAEAKVCRTACALFDFSFVECAALTGARARGIVEAFTGRPLQTLKERGIAYALRIGTGGNVASDLTVWKTGPESFEVMSGRHEDIADLLGGVGPDVDVADLTPGQAIFAVQGPHSLESLHRLGDVDAIAALRYFTFCGTRLAGIPCTIGRLGYTGEAGFEIIVERERAPDLWKALSGVARPAGLIATDILRIEAGFVLFGNEFRLPVLPCEAGLGKFRPSARPAENEVRLVSFRAEADGLSWPWQPPNGLRRPVERGVITVTSACESVVADGILGLGYVATGTTAENALNDLTGVFHNIRIVPMPFYDTAKRRPRAAWRWSTHSQLRKMS